MQSSPNTSQNFTHIWSSRRQNEVKFGGWKEKTISRRPAQILMVIMTFHPDKSLRAIHYVHQQHYSVFSHITSSSDPNSLKFYGWKDKMISNNSHEEHFSKFWLHQCHFIQPKCLSAASTKSTKSIVGHNINNQLPNE